MATLSASGLPFFISACSTDLAVAKLTAAYYERVLEIARAINPRLKRADVLFVGDNRLNDVLGPRLAGMRAAWVNRDRPREALPELMADGATLHLSHLADLPQALGLHHSETEADR